MHIYNLSISPKSANFLFVVLVGIALQQNYIIASASPVLQAPPGASIVEVASPVLQTPPGY